MTDEYPAVPPTESDSGRGKAGVARDQAGQLKDEAMAAEGHVAQTVKDEAADVLGDAKEQAKDLFAQAQSELRDQAGAQQQRVASGLRSVSEQFGEMARNSPSKSVASGLVQQASERAGSVASWLDERDPGSLLGEVRSFASRRPGTFIAVAAAAGILAGRLTRSLSGSSGASGSSGPSNSGSADAAQSPANESVSSADSASTPVYSSLADESLGSTATSAGGFPEESTGLPGGIENGDEPR